MPWTLGKHICLSSFTEAPIKLLAVASCLIYRLLQHNSLLTGYLRPCELEKNVSCIDTKLSTGLLRPRPQHHRRIQTKVKTQTAKDTGGSRFIGTCPIRISPYSKSRTNSSPISTMLICLLSLKCGQFKRFLLSVCFLNEAGGTCLQRTASEECLMYWHKTF